jgi:hypothetical protein
MKILAAVSLIAICLSLVAPVSISMSTSKSKDNQVLVTLDACHSGGSAFSASADVPVIQECSQQIIPPLFSGYVNIFNVAYLLPIIISTQERPPKV